MRLSPPITILSLLAAGLVVLALQNANPKHGLAGFSSIELSATRPWTFPVSTKSGPAQRFGQILIKRDGTFELAIREWKLGEGQSESAFVVTKTSAFAPKLAMDAFAIVDEFEPSAFDADDSIAWDAMAEGRGGTDRHGRPVHRCERMATDVAGDAVKYIGDTEDRQRLAMVSSGCIDSQSTDMKAKLDQVRAIASAVLHVDLEKQVRILK